MRRGTVVGAGLVLVLGLCVFGLAAPSHTPGATALRSASSTLRAGAVTGPPGGGNLSCPAQGPLGGYNLLDTEGLLSLIAVANLGVGILVGRAFAPRTGGQGAGPEPEEPPEPALNPQPLPPGVRPGRPSDGGEDRDDMLEPPDPALTARPFSRVVRPGRPTYGNAGQGGVVEPPDPALNPQPLPRGLRPSTPGTGGGAGSSPEVDKASPLFSRLSAAPSTGAPGSGGGEPAGPPSVRGNRPSPAEEVSGENPPDPPD